jgi:hypothetical protein
VGIWGGLNRNLFLHEMALGVPYSNLSLPPPDPLVLLQHSCCLPLTGSWWRLGPFWGDCLSLWSWVPHKLKWQGFW